MAEASNEDNEVTNINITSEQANDTSPSANTVGTNVKAVLEKLSEFLTENNLEKQIADERKNIAKKIEAKNEEISQKKEMHRHKLYEIHEAYKLEIQKENERHVDDLKVTETAIGDLKSQLEELQQLNYSVSCKIPGNELSTTNRPDRTGRVRELLECPVCLEEMKPPKKISQCSNGHVICELCKNNPEVRSCPTCRVKFRGHNVVRNIVAEKLARSTFDSDESDENGTPGARTSTIESNPVTFHPAENEQFHLVGFEPAYGYRRHTAQGQNDDDDEEDDDDFLAWARIIGQGDAAENPSNNQHRRLGEAAGREEFDSEAGPQTRDQTSREIPREFPGTRELSSMPRMREAQLIRTYRPNPRYLPHHMRRQRAGRGETDEGEQINILEQEDAGGERLFLRAPRVVRRSEEFNDNPRVFRRVL